MFNQSYQNRSRMATRIKESKLEPLWYCVHCPTVVMSHGLEDSSSTYQRDPTDRSTRFNKDGSNRDVWDSNKEFKPALCLLYWQVDVQAVKMPCYNYWKVVELQRVQKLIGTWSSCNRQHLQNSCRDTSSETVSRRVINRQQDPVRDWKLLLMDGTLTTVPRHDLWMKIFDDNWQTSQHFWYSWSSEAVNGHQAWLVL